MLTASMQFLISDYTFEIMDEVIKCAGQQPQEVEKNHHRAERPSEATGKQSKKGQQRRSCVCLH